MKQVLIIGAGASGLMAGIQAARAGAKVTILEHKEQFGKKLLTTGNGKCNLTNTDQRPEHYRGTHPEFAQTALAAFGLSETLRFFSDLGIYTKNRKGYLYPYSEQASAVLEALRMEAEHLKIKISCNTAIQYMEKKDGKFLITTEGWTYEGDALILATGSKAAPATGSDGRGYGYARRFGHRIIEPLPALVQLRSRDACFQKLAGIRCDGTVTLLREGTPLAEEQGEIQFTEYGLSGIPVFQLSRYASVALYKKQAVTAVIDFMPDFTEDMLLAYLKKRICSCTYKTVSQMLIGLCKKKQIEVLLEKAGISGKIPVHNLEDQELLKLVQELKHFTVAISGINSYEHAQVCCGGVDTEEIDPLRMESLLVPGLYFAGEIMDIDGSCGGYNLQWAWTSGALAGIHAGKEQASC